MNDGVARRPAAESAETPGRSPDGVSGYARCTMTTPTTPTATPIEVIPEEAGGHRLERRRPGARHRAGAGHRPGADAGLDERGVAAAHPRGGPDRLLEPLAGELWRKGDTSGERQWVREAYYDCDADTLLFVVEQRARASVPTRASTAASSAASAPAPCPDPASACDRPRSTRRGTSSWRWRVTTRWCRCRARGARRPRDAGVGVRQARRPRCRRATGFLLESVEHAERWGRFSFIGRDPALTMVVRGRHVELDGFAPGIPTDRGALAALEALLAAYRAPRIPSSHRSTAASSATSATTSSARSSTCPTSLPTTRAFPTRFCR